MKHCLFFRVDSLIFSKFYSIRVVVLPLIRMSAPLRVNTFIFILLPPDSTNIGYSWTTPHLTKSFHVPHMLAVLFQEHFTKFFSWYQQVAKTYPPPPPPRGFWQIKLLSYFLCFEIVYQLIVSHYSFYPFPNCLKSISIITYYSL